MRKMMRLRSKRAQGMTEYIIIVGLIAILSIGAFKLFGSEVKKGINESQNKLKTEVTDTIAAGDNAPDAGGN